MHEALLYIWKYEHAPKLKQFHEDIKDGTICVLQMIRTPEVYRKVRGLNETDTFWWINPRNKWCKIMYPFYQQCPYYQGACRYEPKHQKNRNSYCLMEKFSTSKYLNESKKEYDFLSKNKWSKSSGEDINKYSKNSPEEIKLFGRYLFSLQMKQKY